MATKPTVVIGGGSNGGKTVTDELGNTEHRQKVLADMEANGMGDMAQRLSTSHGITYTPKANTDAPATAPTAAPADANGGIDINGVINETEEFYNKQIENANNRAGAMMALQQQMTDFEVKKIEQQKEQTKKDFEKEQTAAYTDYQKQINPYGANAEQLASQGMSGTGYAESSKVRMYSDYQNRVAVARQSYTQAITAYDNAMTEARLQNSAVLAQLAFDTLEKTLELATQGLIYKNELLMERENILYQRNWAEEDRDYNRGRDIIEDNQYKEAFDYQKERDNVSDYQWNKGYELEQEKVDNVTYDFTNEESEPEITNPIDLNTIVSTEFYNDTVNPDAQYGVFKTKDANGFAYQPNNIDGKPLKPSGDTYTFDTIILYGKDRGKIVSKTQTVWELDDGRKWLWDGILNRYKEFPPGRQIHVGQMMIDIDSTQAPHAVL